LECNGQYVYPESGYAINNILPLNSVSTQTVSNPAPVANGGFLAVTWITSTKFLTSAATLATNPRHVRYYVFDYNPLTKQFGTNTLVNSAWGLNTTNDGRNYTYAGKFEDTIVLITASSAVNAYISGLIKIINFDVSGNYVSTDTIDTTFTVGTVSLNSHYLECVPYMYNGEKFIFVYHTVSPNTGPKVTSVKLYKNISGVWTLTPISINIPSSLSTNIPTFSIHNSYIAVTTYVAATTSYQLHIAKFIDESTVDTFYPAWLNGGGAIVPDIDLQGFDGVAVQKYNSTDYTNRLSIVTVNGASATVVSSLNFTEYAETGGLSIPARSLKTFFLKDSFFNNLKTAYGVSEQNSLIMVNFNVNKKLGAYSISVNSSGILSKTFIEAHTFTASFGAALFQVRGMIDRDFTFSSSAGRLLVIFSKVQLPTLTALATNLKYYLKVN
jgi:hypothetical protein